MADESDEKQAPPPPIVIMRETLDEWLRLNGPLWPTPARSPVATGALPRLPEPDDER